MKLHNLNILSCRVLYGQGKLEALVLPYAAEVQVLVSNHKAFLGSGFRLES
jgi:hypothetical protein